MALPILAKAIGGSLVKGAAKKAIGGGKKKISPEMIAPGGRSNGSGGAIVKAKVVSVPSSAIVPVAKSPIVKAGTGSGIVGILETIRANVRQIDDFYKGTLAAKREEIKKRKKQESDERKAEQETKLEKPKIDKKPKNMKGLKMPKTGILDGIFKFISTVLLGMLVMKLIDFADTLAKTGILETLGKIGDFVLDVGGKILDGLVTFIDKAYDFYDGFRKAVGDNFGEGAQEQFDSLAGTLNKVLNTVFSVGLAISLLAGAIPQNKPPGGVLRKTKPDAIKRYARRFGRDAAIKRFGKNSLTTLTKPGTVRKYAQRFGKNAAINKFGKDAVKKFGGSAGRSTATNLARRGLVGALGKGGTKAGLKFLKNFISPIVKRIPIIGGLIDFALNYFVFKEPIGRSAFAAIGSTIFGALGATAGSIIPVVGNFVGGALGGLAGDMAGKWLYDTFFTGKKPVNTSEVQGKEKVSANQSISPYVPKSTVESDEMSLFKRLVLAEAGGEGKLGMALVARRVLNRTGLIQTGKATTGTFLADSATVRGVIMGRGQYQPVSDGSIYKERSVKELEQAGIAIELAQDTTKLESMLKAEGLSDSDVGKIISATGFRTGSAFNDPSQNVNVVQYKNHFFNTAGNPGVVVAKANIARANVEPAANVDISTSSGDSREDSEGTKISGNLGRFLYKELSSPKDFLAVTEHPDFGGSFKRSYNSYHNYDRAIDIGVLPHEQPKILEAIKKFNQLNGVSPVELLHAGNDPSGGHDDHIHIAYEGGGYVGGRYNMKSIERRASYEGGEQMINIPIPAPQQQISNQEPQPSMMGSVSATISDDPFEFLEFQG